MPTHTPTQGQMMRPLNPCLQQNDTHLIELTVQRRPHRNSLLWRTEMTAAMVSSPGNTPRPPPGEPADTDADVMQRERLH